MNQSSVNLKNLKNAFIYLKFTIISYFYEYDQKYECKNLNDSTCKMKNLNDIVKPIGISNQNILHFGEWV
jgi:hypothetical protein